MESQWEVCGSRQEPHRAQRNLHKGVYERAQGTFTAERRLAQCLAMGAQHTAPEVERVNVLPVVHLPEGVVAVVFYRATQVDRQLPDQCEAGRVSHVRVREAPELRRGVFHKVDTRDGVLCCVPRAFQQALVYGAQHSFSDPGVADDGDAAQDKESRDARGFCVRSCGPDVGRAAEEVTEELFEAEEVRK